MNSRRPPQLRTHRNPAMPSRELRSEKQEPHRQTAPSASPDHPDRPSRVPSRVPAKMPTRAHQKHRPKPTAKKRTYYSPAQPPRRSIRDAAPRSRSGDSQARGLSDTSVSEAPVSEAPEKTSSYSHDAHSQDLHEHGSSVRTSGRNWNADWKLVWEGEKKSHQISLRLIAILAFAALAVLIVISPLRSFVQQQEQISSLHSQLDASEEHIKELQDEIDLWNDPQFIQSQARERLGYVMPGQTLYLVSGGEADPQRMAQKKIEQANEQRRAITPFYVTLWDSISVAGQVGEYENPQNVPVMNDSDNDPRDRVQEKE